MLPALLYCHFSIIFHPDGMLLLPVVFGNAAGHLNVFSPVAYVPASLTQFAVALVGLQAVELTAIDARLLHPRNMPE